MAILTDLANLLEEPHRQMLHGFFHGSDRRIQGSLRSRDLKSRAQERRSFQCDLQSVGGMDGSTGNRCFSMRHGPEISDKKSEFEIYPIVNAAISQKDDRSSEISGIRGLVLQNPDLAMKICNCNLKSQLQRNCQQKFR